MRRSTCVSAFTPGKDLLICGLRERTYATAALLLSVRTEGVNVVFLMIGRHLDHLARQVCGVFAARGADGWIDGLIAKLVQLLHG